MHFLSECHFTPTAEQLNQVIHETIDLPITVFYYNINPPLSAN